jgi:hypothetical protein
MIGEMLCPDCGGVVGATETTEAGAPCRCFTQTPGKSDTLVSETMVAETLQPAEAPVSKICRICGKDVSHEKRVKDNQGYYCYPCAKEEDKKDHQGRVRCKVCGKLTREEHISEYDGKKMCHRCQAERNALKKQQIKRIGFKSARTREELRRIYIMAAVLAVLLLVMLYGALKMMHGH